MNTTLSSRLRPSRAPFLVPRPIVLPFLVAACLLLLGSTASAQARPEGVVIGLERAFGFSFSQLSGEGSDETQTGFTLGTPSISSLYALPRLGVDYVLPNGVSFGSGLGLLTVSNDDGEDFDSRATILTLAPRAGYVAMLSPRLALWPRAGLSVLRTSTSISFGSTEEESATTEIALTAEAPFVFLPIPEVGILLAPTFDRTLSTSSDDEVDSEVKTTAVGIHAGIVVNF